MIVRAVYVIIWALTGMQETVSTSPVNRRQFGHNAELRMAFPTIHEYDYNTYLDSYAPASKHVDIVEVRRSHDGPSLRSIWGEEDKDATSNYDEAVFDALLPPTEKKKNKRNRKKERTRDRQLLERRNKRPTSLAKRKRWPSRHVQKEAMPKESYDSSEIHETVDDVKKELFEQMMKMMKSAIVATPPPETLTKGESTLGDPRQPSISSRRALGIKPVITEASKASSPTIESAREARRFIQPVFDNTMKSETTKVTDFSSGGPVKKQLPIMRSELKTKDTTSSIHVNILPMVQGESAESSGTNSRSMSPSGSSRKSSIEVSNVKASAEVPSSTVRPAAMNITTQQVTVLDANSTEAPLAQRSLGRQSVETQKAHPTMPGENTQVQSQRRSLGECLTISNPPPIPVCHPCSLP